VRIGNALSLLDKLRRGEKWDIVFNVAEGVAGRNRESQVPVILEMFGVPYTGSDALTMGLTLDKAVAKMVLAYRGIATPRFVEAASAADLKSFDLKFPVIVKPAREGTSKGISSDSVAKDIAAVRKRVKEINNRYSQPALVEEFISGQEFTVAVIGTNPPEVLPPVQISLEGDVDLGDEFYTHTRAMVGSSEIEYLCPSKAPKALIKKIETLARDSYIALGCRDLGRIDIRVDRKGVPYFLECNPLPHLGLIDVFPLVARAMGLTYEKLICRILEHGLKRYGINNKQDKSQ
jgi:D-alanine-D-alanine ligase